MAKVLIGIPVRQRYGQPSYKTQQCLKLMRESSQHAIEIFCAGGSQISQNSVIICNKVLDEGWDYLLYTGDDIIFPPWALDRLMKHDVDFVSGVCTWKSPPFMVPVGVEDTDGKFKHILIRPEHVKNEVVMEVDGVGSGFILVKRRALEAVRDYMRDKVYPKMAGELKWFAPLPFFSVSVNAENGELLGSDFFFSKQCRLAGIKIHIDCGLLCRHRWEGEYDITNHWDWMEKHGAYTDEERFFGDQVPWKNFEENSIFWGPQGPPVQITVTSTGNLYHAQEHVAPALGAHLEPITAEGKPKTSDGYIIGWHVGSEEEWQLYTAWAKRFTHTLVHWVGSDITNIPKWMNSPERVAHMNHPRFVHLVEDERLLPELKQYFENVHVVPIPTMNTYPIAPLPEKFTVAVYYPQHRHDFHYGHVLREVIEKMPDVQFNLYHLFGKEPEFKYPNMVWLGNLNKEQHHFVLAQSSCMLRLSQHDGRPFSIIEAAIMGRRFITNFDMPFTHRTSDVPTASEVIKLLKKIREIKETDTAASKYYTEENNILKYKQRIRTLIGSAEPLSLGYSYKQYWDARWYDKTSGSPDEKSLNDWVNKKTTETIAEMGVESILDVGCGSMNRWDALPVKADEYIGVDVSPRAIKMAQEKFPEATFFVADITKDTLPIKDMVIANGVLPHIKPDDFQATLRKLMGVARKAVIFSHTFGVEGGGYQYKVPYPDQWGVEGVWDCKVFDTPGGSTIQVVVCKKQEVACPQ